MLKSFGILYRVAIKSNCGGVLLHVREEIPCNFLKVKSVCNVEYICVEANLRKS